MNARAVRDGHWLVPRLHDGRLELQKPPLYYWLVAAMAHLRGGVDAWAVRLPSALAALVGVTFLACFGWRVGRPRAGLLASAILATTVHFTWLARVGRIDMPLTTTISLALGCFYLALRKEERGPTSTFPFLVVAYLSLAVAMLLKGPIGIVLPAAALATYLLLEGTLPPPWRVRCWARLGHRLGLWWGVPLVLGLSGTWFWLADQATEGELIRVFFWHHNVERGLGGSRLRSHPWWFYGPRGLLDFLPWSVLLPGVGWYFFRRMRWREDALARFGLAWALAMTVVLSCARYKRADYLVPAYPGLALFLGSVLAGSACRTGGSPGCMPTQHAQNLALCLVLAGSALGWWVRVSWVLPLSEPHLEHRSFATVVRSHVPPAENVLFFQTEAHTLAFHIGPPLRVLLSWDELDRLDTLHHVVMPAAQARDADRHLKRVRLEEIARNTDRADGHEKPLVLFRVLPNDPGAKGSYTGP